MENKTLAHVVSQNGQQTQGHDNPQTTQSFNTFLTLYGVILAQKFPDVTDLNSIEYVGVKKIADFSIACAYVGMEAWEENQGLPTQARQRILRQTRSA